MVYEETFRNESMKGLKIFRKLFPEDLKIFRNFSKKGLKTFMSLFIKGRWAEVFYSGRPVRKVVLEGEGGFVRSEDR